MSELISTAIIMHHAMASNQMSDNRVFPTASLSHKFLRKPTFSMNYLVTPVCLSGDWVMRLVLTGLSWPGLDWAQSSRGCRDQAQLEMSRQWGRSWQWRHWSVWVLANSTDCPHEKFVRFERHSENELIQFFLCVEIFSYSYVMRASWSWNVTGLDQSLST